MSIFLCENADPILGHHCPSARHLAQLPPGFDDHDPEGYKLGSSLPSEIYDDELDMDTDRSDPTDVTRDTQDFAEDDLLSRFAQMPLDDGEVEASTAQVADESDEHQSAPSQPASFTSRGLGDFPLRDARSLRVMVIGDVNHMHGLGVQFCSCRGARPRDEQLLEYGIYPASADRPATGFTLHSLDYLRVDELECKTTPEAYSKKVRRLTSPHDWRGVPVNVLDLSDVRRSLPEKQNRYPELLRCDREYRACVALLNHGFAHQVLEDWIDPGAGDLAYHCVTCPRPSGPLCNMPLGWAESPYRWGYQYVWNIDGNFEGQHTASRVPENNVYLYPGTAMFNNPEDETRVLRDAVDDNDLPENKVIVLTRA